MVLYHVSFEHTAIPKTFIPRVPSYLKPVEEDVSTPRISFSDTVEHALSAMADTPYITKPDKPITIYKANIPQQELITPEYLYYNNLVEDALYTREHWLLHSITLEGKHMHLREFESDSYIMPQEKKLEKFWSVMRSHVPEQELTPYLQTPMDEMLREVIPSHWSTWGVESCDIGNEVGLINIRVMYNCKLY